LTLESSQGIPRTDLEVVLPHRQVCFQPMDQVLLVVVTVMTCIAVAKAYFSANTGKSTIVVIVIMAMNIFQMFRNMRKMNVALPLTDAIGKLEAHLEQPPVKGNEHNKYLASLISGQGPAKRQRGKASCSLK